MTRIFLPSIHSYAGYHFNVLRLLLHFKLNFHSFSGAAHPDHHIYSSGAAAFGGRMFVIQTSKHSPPYPSVSDTVSLAIKLVATGPGPHSISLESRRGELPVEPRMGQAFTY